ncbi:hypothetical protein GK047_11105 [Paenibacillus sp. SYP-B3998]|uniref:Uncharacterized protein n=1 Tax=Paenibacillus sp. SYP-B3998 TaxID=2678564 RepID=A0A6G3ZWV5_9BACL|nr:hypothetical protein [Paenibacillus sp. SYP-B3998]NEW06560.1 hypothetical protein [Paenibacillus sp. SYP-B3998]
MKLNKKLLMAFLLCMLVFTMVPLAASAATVSNTAQGQGDLYLNGTFYVWHGGDLILTEVTTGRTVFKSHYSEAANHSPYGNNLNNYVISNLPSGTYQLTWTDSIGGSLSIHF